MVVVEVNGSSSGSSSGDGSRSCGGSSGSSECKVCEKKYRRVYHTFLSHFRLQKGCVLFTELDFGTISDLLDQAHTTRDNEIRKMQLLNCNLVKFNYPP